MWGLSIASIAMFDDTGCVPNFDARPCGSCLWLLHGVGKTRPIAPFSTATCHHAVSLETGSNRDEMTDVVQCTRIREDMDGSENEAYRKCVNFKENMTGWWFQSLWKCESQLGWWHSQLNGKLKVMFQTTNQYSAIVNFVLYHVVSIIYIPYIMLYPNNISKPPTRWVHGMIINHY